MALLLAMPSIFMERKEKMRKKLFLFGFLTLVFAMLFSSTNLAKVNAEVKATEKVQIHFHRESGDYSKYSLWVWAYAPTSGEGKDYPLDKTDDYGVYAEINLSAISNATKIGVIYKYDGWSKQSPDIICDVATQSENGIAHIYLLDGDVQPSYSYEEASRDRFLNANFTDTNKITMKIFSSEGTINASKVKFYINNTLTAFQSFVLQADKYVLTTSSNVDLSNDYRVEIELTKGTISANIGFSGIYDSAAFVNKFGYEGTDLGITFNEAKNKTTFKLWAPISSVVKLNLYENGTPAQIQGGSNSKIKEVSMTLGEKGVWSYTENANLHGKYYTYSVTNNGVTTETMDPYAKGCGVNGLRGLVVDFAQINPEGFEYGKRADNIEKRTDAIIYEMHVRDYTKNVETWGGTAANAGKYLGLTEKGTKYRANNVDYSTGLDHLVELGVTHVQIMPFYDQATVNEADTNPSYNWGYDPLNYNCLEGSYSSNAKDGFARIIEFKKMSMALNDVGIRINMDVVYNHTAKSGDSNFEIIVPGYYHRRAADGSFSNGSGCGNEMASERFMVSKFIVDSAKFWMTEYNLSGYRFDLMGLVDTGTMGKVYNELSQIDELVLVYGEPWTGGTTLNNYRGTYKETIKYIEGVGVFNDDTRDAIVGRVPSPNSPGWLQYDGGSISQENVNKIKFGISGGTFDGYTPWTTEDPARVINYVSCHDNNTLWDKIRNTFVNNKGSWKTDFMVDINNQADSIVFFSQGIPFIQEGQEFLRTKPKLAGVGEGVTYDFNSYKSPDEVNMVRWNLKAENNGVYKYYKDLISFRKSHEAFRLSSAEEVADALTFLETEDGSLIAYRLKTNKDSYKDLIVIHNVNDKQSYKLPSGKWQVVFDNTGEIKNPTTLKTSSVEIDINETIVLRKEMSSGGCGKSSTNMAFVFLTIALLGIVVLKLRKHV